MTNKSIRYSSLSDLSSDLSSSDSTSPESVNAGFCKQFKKILSISPASSSKPDDCKKLYFEDQSTVEVDPLETDNFEENLNENDCGVTEDDKRFLRRHGYFGKIVAIRKSHDAVPSTTEKRLEQMRARQRLRLLSRKESCTAKKTLQF